MKALKTGVLGMLLIMFQVNVIFARDVSITIDKIVANEVISGTVRNLDPRDYSNYKVIVYVHTDQWYIHPYAAQDEGLSWASIKENGTWQIKTVQREFRADKISVLIVKRTYPEPNKLESLEKIPNKAITIKVLKNTPDYGKL
ncbi:MAG: hypothetical protein HYR55_01965 [Acidobacteria bacterium]|nr:hypothetical protein [Acidobacteriota bacterium]MBI3655370.1 hypothetical protein [Acidobacteriota bacterium]